MEQFMNSYNEKLKILIIEDEPFINKLIQSTLKLNGYNVFGVSTGNDAVKWTIENPDNFLIIDFLLPDMNAMELVDKLKSEKINFNFIIMTGYQDQNISVEMMKKGAKDYIIKDNELINVLPGIVNKAINDLINEKKLKEANEKIKNQYELLNGIISHLPNYIFWKDISSTYLGCNEKFARLLGFQSSDEIIGKNDFTLGLNKLDANMFVKYDKIVIESGKPTLGIEEAFIENINQKLPLLTNRAPLKDSNGNIIGILVICTDLSELEEIDETIKVSEEKFRELFDNMPSGVATYKTLDKGESFIFKDINKAFEKKEKIKRDNVIGKNIIEIFPDSSSSNLVNAFKRIYKTGKSEHFPVIKYKDNRISEWRDYFVYKLSNEEIVAIYNDLTTQKQYEELLTEYKLAIESSEDSICCVNKSNKLIFANQAFIDQFNLKKNQIENINIKDIVGNEYFLKYIKSYFLEAIKGKSVNYEVENKNPNSNKRFIKINYYPLKKENNSDDLKEDKEYNAVVAFLRDITPQKKLELELKKLNEELEKRVIERTHELIDANNELESFAYSVSHDLRAPLRHIFGFSELLQKEIVENLKETGKKYLKNIIESTKKMSVLIDDLLSFSRMGRTNLNLTKINLNKLIDEIIKLLENETKNRIVKFNIEKLPKIDGDLSMLRQVFVNLISNAIKYTQNKKNTLIEIGYKQDNENYIIYIKDNGIGFNSKYKDKLFGVFQRLHSDREYEGTGIGLAIVKRIISRHNGKVWAEGKMNKGATFYLSLQKKQ